jgi:hypothetical protein
MINCYAKVLFKVAAIKSELQSTAAKLDGGAGEFSGEIIDCLSKFIDTSELSQTSMDFFYDSEDSSFSTTRNALLLAETEHQSEGAKGRCRKRGERYLPRFKEKVRRCGPSFRLNFPLCSELGTSCKMANGLRWIESCLTALC